MLCPDSDVIFNVGVLCPDVIFTVLVTMVSYVLIMTIHFVGKFVAFIKINI